MVAPGALGALACPLYDLYSDHQMSHRIALNSPTQACHQNL